LPLHGAYWVCWLSQPFSAHLTHLHTSEGRSDAGRKSWLHAITAEGTVPSLLKYCATLCIRRCPVQ
jgi:hypothetical protein